jgi:DNA polymerase-3 subunit delta
MRELEKLAAYMPTGQTITPAAVEAVRGGEAGASVFELIAAIGAKNYERVLLIVARNLEAGEAPLRILGSLVWQYRQLWKAKDLLNRGGADAEVGRMLRMPPFRVREFLGRFSDRHLRTAFAGFLDTDSKLKGASAGTPRRVLEMLLLGLCGRDRVSGLPPKDRPPVTQTRTGGENGHGNRYAKTVRSARPSPR